MIGDSQISVRLRKESRLDEAKAMFQQSLEFEPNNKVALNELRYIEHLRPGGAMVTPNIGATQGNSPSKCVSCGRQTQNDLIINVRGMTLTLCHKGKRNLTKNGGNFGNRG